MNRFVHDYRCFAFVSMLKCTVAMLVFIPAIMFAAGLHGMSTEKSSSSARMLPVERKIPENSKYLPDRVIVKLKGLTTTQRAKYSFGISTLDRFVQQYGAESIAQIFPEKTIPIKESDIDLSGIYVLKYSSPIDPFTVAKEISAQADVEYAEPWFIYSTHGVTAFTPNDTSFVKQWALRKIQAAAAWGVSQGQGDTTIVLAIVDTGVEWLHPDLAGNIWQNPGEIGLDAFGNDKRTNGIDDDGNGYVDDWHGWDFAGADYNNLSQDNNPAPTASNNTHGTHLSGIASAMTNNVTGIAGVGFKCKIMPVKTSADNDFRDQGISAFILAGFQGIVYAADNGATAINLSWGGPGASQFEQNIINYATQKGSLVIAAAGNDQVTHIVDYPAAYDNVIAVAATDTSDHLTYYSSYGPAVDVCAPGGIPGTSAAAEIYSTLWPSTYALGAGTSQATPHVTGLAGLVKAHFPSYTALQIGEQIRVTCDDISAQNPTLTNKFGKGRINAFKALTVSSPSIRMTGLSVNDLIGGNNNHVAEPGETIDLIFKFTNYLQPTSPGATVTITTTDAFLQILDGASFPLGSVGTLDTTTNLTQPLLVHINSNVPLNHVANFTLTINDGSYTDFQIVPLLIYPTFATHNINDITVTLTNIGRIGFTDATSTSGDGFIFGNGNQLYEGGLIIGTSATKLVNVVRNGNCTGCQDNDFMSNQPYVLQTPGTVSSQDGYVTLNDSGAASANRVGVQVKMYSYAYANVSDRDYVIIRYDIKNISGASLSNLYAGLFFDWDMLSPITAQDRYFDHNRTSFDATRNLGYAWYDTTVNTTYCGARVLNGTAGYAGLARDSVTGTRAEKWSWVSGGVQLMNLTTDIHFAISSGPFTISNGATQTVGFALVAGHNLSEIQANSDIAATKWNDIQLIAIPPLGTQLLAPANFSVDQPTSVQFQWRSSSHASSYRLQVATDTNFTQLRFNGNVVDTTKTDDTLQFGTKYYWRVMAQNVYGNSSWSSVSTFTTLAPSFQPTFSISIHQNPVVTQYADLYVSTNDTITALPSMTISTNTIHLDPIVLSQVTTAMYKGSYQFVLSGADTMIAHVLGRNGLDTTIVKIMQVGLFKRGIAQTLHEPQGNASIHVSSDALDEDTYFTAMVDERTTSDTRIIGETYLFGPQKSYSKSLTISINIPRQFTAQGKERSLHVYQYVDAKWIALESWVDARHQTIQASVHVLGTFALGYDEQVLSNVLPTDYALFQNYPNPFNPQTLFRFALPEGGHVRLTIFNVMGQEITTLVDEDQDAGIRELTWEGKDRNNAPVASGVYFYRLRVTDGSGVKFVKTDKMIMLK